MRRLAIPLVVCALAACSSPSARPLVILHTNDEHSHLLGDGPEADDLPAPTTPGDGGVQGGLARRAALFAEERAAAQAAGADVLTVSAGDNAMGTVAELGFTSGTDYASLGLLGYDVTTLGDHELDWGPGALATSIVAGASGSPRAPAIVASNIHFSGTSGDAALAALFDESGSDAALPIHRTWVVTTQGGIKVGFVGIMGVAAAANAPLKAPLTFSQPALGGSDPQASMDQLFDDVQPLVERLRAEEKVDLVVALSHSGVDPDDLEAGEDQQLAENVAGIDVIVSGHTHTNYPAALVTNPSTGRQVLIQQAGRSGDHYGRIAMTVKVGASPGDPQPVVFDLSRSTTVPIDDTTVGDAAAAGFVSSVYAALETTPVAALDGLSYLDYTASLAAGTQLPAPPAQVGAIAYAPIVKSSYTIHQGAAQTETPLLRAAADAVLFASERASGQTDVALEAAGLLRGDVIPARSGQLAFGDLFVAVPLGISPSGEPGWPLTRFALYLAELKAAFEVTAGLAYSSDAAASDFLVPSGFCFRYDTSLPAFDPHGSALDPQNGRVTEIRMMADHTQLDACETDGALLYSTAPSALAQSPTGYLVNPLGLYSVAANLYVAELASLAGLKLKDPATGSPLASAVDGVEYAQPGPGVYVEIKEWEAMGAWLRALASASGTLPPLYDDAQAAGVGPFRAICSGPLCQ